MNPFDALIAALNACRVCAEYLPLGPHPVFQLAPTARLLITSQAPGTKAHLAGLPFHDRSGERLRHWLGLSEAQFYDAEKIAILPVGLCYPGRAKKGSGDAPPRPECAPLWREQLLAHLADLQLTLLVGSHAQNLVLGAGNMTERVRNFRSFLPEYFPLPHPSWRTGHWERQNPWFAAEVLPELRAMVSALLA
ncbi:MAG: uracil-DNA glycosylase family protein [Sphingomonadaceae bacterium]